MRFLRLSFRLLPPGKRWGWVALVPLMVAAAAAESVGAAGVFFLIAVLSQPEQAGEMPVVAALTRILPSTDGVPSVVAMTAALAVFYVLKNTFLALVTYLQYRLFQHSTAALAVRLLEGYLDVPYVYHLHRNSAELIHRVNEGAHRVVNLVMGAALALVAEVLVVVGVLAVLVAVAPLVTLVTGSLLSVVMTGLLLLTQRRFYSLGRREIEVRKKALQTVQQTLEGMKEIRVFGRPDYFQRLYSRQQSTLARIVTWLRFLENLPRLLVETVFVLATFGVVALVLGRGAEPRELVPVLGLYAYAGFRLIPSLNKILRFFNQFWYGSASVDDLSEDYQSFQAARAERAGRAEHGVRAEHGARAEQTPSSDFDFHDRIEIQGVSFAYDQKTILKDIDLTIPRGASIGIVGATGAGKSTLVDLLLGLLEPSRGSIEVDGVNIRSALSAWQRKIGYVPQTLFLTDDTLLRNVAFGLEDSRIDRQRVIEAVRLVGLEDLVKIWREGLETMVGERGVRLSGGQRQRVAMARALYRDPQLLVLDEATSALDGQSEKEMGETLGALRNRKTLVIVAHRLSTIQSCDCLIYLRDGRIEARGTFEELTASSESFRRRMGL